MEQQTIVGIVVLPIVLMCVVNKSPDGSPDGRITHEQTTGCYCYLLLRPLLPLPFLFPESNLNAFISSTVLVTASRTDHRTNNPRQDLVVAVFSFNNVFTKSRTAESDNASASVSVSGSQEDLSNRSQNRLYKYKYKVRYRTMNRTVQYNTV